MENQKPRKLLIPILVSSLLVTFLTLRSAVAATIKEAMIAAKSGQCEVFAPANETAKSTEATLVIFEGKKYQSISAKIGMKIQPGYMLRTGTDGKLKVIYSSGDVVVLGPSTAMTVPQVSEVAAQPAELVYGKMRASINKEGPLSGFKVATPAAVAGVRGTDFFMSFHPGLSEAEVHVLRGKVTVQKVAVGTVNADGPATDSVLKKPQVIEIKTGEKVSVEKEKTEDLRAVKTNQVELKQIESSSVVAVSKQSEKIEDVLVIQELKERETKSVEVVKKDIKEVLGEKVDLSKVTNFEQAQAITVSELNQQAPKGPKKPKRKDFEAEGDVYDQFFKPVK